MSGSSFLLSLGCHSKQAGNEPDLAGDVSFVYSLYLSFAKHVHDLISLQRSLRSFQRKEAQPGLDQAFDEPVVLFNQIVQVFDLPSFHVVWQDSGGFQISNSSGRGGVLISVENTESWLRGFLRLLFETHNCMLLTFTALRHRTDGTLQRFAEKASGGLGVSCGTQEKFQGSASRIHCAIEIHPGLFHLHRGFIDTPRVIAGFDLAPIWTLLANP